MLANKYTKLAILGIVVLFLIAGTMSVIDYYARPGLWLSSISFLIYCTGCILFIIYARHDLPYPKMKRDYMVLTSLLLAWLILDLLQKIVFAPINGTAGRIIWYAYYIPTTLIPNVLMFAMLRSGIYPVMRFNSWYYITFVISSILSVLVLFNDYHHLALRITDIPSEDPLVPVYSYGPLYYVIMAWAFFMFFMSVFIIYRGVRVRASMPHTKVMWNGFFLLVIYFIWWVTGKPVLKWFDHFFGLVEFMVSLLILSLEISIRFCVIRSNFNYTEFFEYSTICGSIYDSTGVRYRTKNYIRTTKEQRRKALLRPEYLDDSHRIVGKHIKGGRLFWVEDITPVKELSEQLKEMRDGLRQENDLINAENEIKKRRKTADEQNMLLSLLSKNVNPYIKAIESILDKADMFDEEKFKEELALACVYKVFVKRYCNMILMSQDDKELNLFELRSALAESLDYLSLNKVETQLRFAGNKHYDAQVIIGAYMVYQTAVEAVIGKIYRTEVAVNEHDSGFKMDIDIYGRNIPCITGDIKRHSTNINKLGGSLEVLCNPGHIMVFINFREGGSNE